MKNTDIKKIILRHFPKSKIKSVKEFPEGYNNIAYDVRSNEGDYVVKILKIKGYEEYVLKQNKLRKLIRSKFKNFPIAKIIKYDFSCKLIDKPYVLLEKIEGKSVRESFNHIENKQEVFEEIGKIYGMLHSFRMDSYGELDPNLRLVKVYKNWFNEKCKIVKKTISTLESQKLLSQKTLKKSEEFFEENKLLLKKEIGPRLCHGDSSLENILLKKEGCRHFVSGIIDFEFSRSSGVVEDLFSGLMIPDRKMEYKDELVRGYLQYSNLPKDWENLVYLYKWINYLNRISKISKMSWRNLNETQILERRKIVRKNVLINLRKYQKMLAE